MRSLLKIAVLVSASAMILAIAWLNIRLYALPKGVGSAGTYAEDVPLQLKNIGRRLRIGEGRTMQHRFPEGWFFSHLLYGFAWVNVGLQTTDHALRDRAISEARWVLAQANTEEGRARFKSDTQVPNGVFYLGWKNRLLGGLLKLCPADTQDQQEAALYHSQSETLARAYLSRPTHYLDAYPGQAWPCDNVMALASLALHDELYGSQYKSVIAAWTDFTRKHLDPATGLIPHKIDGITGRELIVPRGSSQVYIQALLPELDAHFAREQYTIFRRLFVVDVLGFLPVREYPIRTSGAGDVDTGPLLFGISPAATTVSIAAARANGDMQLSERNVILSEILGFPSTHGDEKSFAFGKVVVADAFLAWAKSLTPWSGTEPRPFPADAEPRWRWKIHALSLAAIGALACCMKMIIRAR